MEEKQKALLPLLNACWRLLDSSRERDRLGLTWEDPTSVSVFGDPYQDRVAAVILFRGGLSLGEAGRPYTMVDTRQGHGAASEGLGCSLRYLQWSGESVRSDPRGLLCWNGVGV